MEITRGDTLAFKFRRLDLNGSPIVVTPDSLYFTVKTAYTESQYVLQKKLEDMTVDADGTYHVVVTAEETEALPRSSYVYDIEVTQDGVVTTIAKGDLIITEQATWEVNK